VVGNSDRGVVQLRAIDTRTLPDRAQWAARDDGWRLGGRKATTSSSSAKSHLRCLVASLSTLWPRRCRRVLSSAASSRLSRRAEFRPTLLRMPPQGMRRAHSGHSSGTVWALGSIPTAQKCPSRLARPARFERATGMFVMQELTRCPGSRSPPLPFSSARRAGCGRKRRTPPTIPDRVRGQFTASAPDVLWVGDINSRAHRGKAG
jgi:hypothetical protein